MFTVAGRYHNTPYLVSVSGARVTVKNQRLKTDLAIWSGDRVGATPTGPFYTLDLTNPASVLAALTERTHIIRVTGTPPTVAQALPPGAVG